jgi:conjugal transfer mating pair stabilization protein TraG
MMSTVNDNGTFTKRTADGSTVFDTSPGMSRLAFGASLSQFNNTERQQTLSELETARSTLSEERSRALSFLDRTSSRQTSGVRNSSGTESTSGFRSGENLQRFDNQSLDSRDGVSESDRVTSSRGNQQTNTDRLETTRSGSAGLSGAVGRGNSRGTQGRGSGAGLNGGVNAGVSGGRLRTDSVTTGGERVASKGFDSSTSDNRSNGSNATQDAGSYAQSGSFNRSEGYSDNSFSRERALEEVRRIDERIAAIDELSTSLSNNTSSRDGYGSNISFDMSQIVASRYQEKAAELGITAPSLARTDYAPHEQAAYELVARDIISDYYDERVAPYRDLIPDEGSVVGNVSGPGQFSEADLRASTPQRSHGGPRSFVSGSNDGSIGERIDEGAEGLGDRYERNGSRYGEWREEFEGSREGLGGANDRFNERFYDRDQRKRNRLQRTLRGDDE